MSIQLGARHPPILFIIGSDREEDFDWRDGKLSISGSTDIHKLLGIGEPHHRLRIASDLPRKRWPNLTPYRCIVNLITEAEHNRRLLDLLRKLLLHTPAKVINPPEPVLRSTRDLVARRLAGIPGLRVPRVIRLRTTKPEVVARTIEQAKLTFPLIVRQAGTHTGRIVGRFDSADELGALSGASGDHLATEFVDFRSADGLYRKYRVFFIGKHVIFRHLLVSDRWNVHGKDRDRFMADRPDLIQEEVDLLSIPDGAFPPRVKDVLTTVRKRMDLDFFGMDFALLGDGGVVLFEANATMNFYSLLPGPEFDYLQAVLPPARAAFRDLLGLPPRGPEISPDPVEPA